KLVTDQHSSQTLREIIRKAILLFDDHLARTINISPRTPFRGPDCCKPFMKISSGVVISFDYGISLKIYKATEVSPDYISTTFAKGTGIVEAGWDDHVSVFIDEPPIVAGDAWLSFWIKVDHRSPLMELPNQSRRTR